MRGFCAVHRFVGLDETNPLELWRLLGFFRTWEDFRASLLGLLRD